MPTTPNKVKCGLTNVYYAVATSDGNGVLTYGTPVRWPGAVSLSMAQQSGETTFYADNVAYFKTNASNGYEGDFESALIPDSFRTDVLGEVLDTKGFYVEKAGRPTVEFALLFQFEGDDKATRHVLYNVVASRPSVTGQTTEESIEAQTETVNLTCSSIYNAALAIDIVKARCPETATTAYTSWFSAVHQATT